VSVSVVSGLAPSLFIYNLTESSRNPTFWTGDFLRMAVGNLPANQTKTLESCHTYLGSSGCDIMQITADFNGTWRTEFQVLGISLGNWSRWVRVDGVASNLISYSVVNAATAQNGTLSFSQNSFNFNYTQGGTTPPSQSLTFVNTSVVPVNYTANINSPPPWFHADQPPWFPPTTLTVSPGQTASLGISVFPAGLSPGTYTTNITLTGNFVGSPKSIPVTLAVSPATLPLTITNNSPLPNAIVGIFYSLDIIPDGGLIRINPGNVSWRIVSGSLPPGLATGSGSSTCANVGCMGIGGTPTTAGTYNFTLSVSDGTNSLSKSFALTASEPTVSGPAVTVLSPNGGEEWTIGQQARISWRRNWMPSGANGLVDILINNGWLNTLIASGVQDPTGFWWVVPNWLSPGTNYKVVVTSRGFGGSLTAPLSDESDRVFSIRLSPTLTPTASPTPAVSPTPTPTCYWWEDCWQTPTPTPTLTPTPSPTPTLTPIPTPTPTPSPTPVSPTRLYTLSEIYDGDLIRGQGDIAVWIVKTVGEKRYKRWLFGPQIFRAYSHLGFDKVKNVSKETSNRFDTSNLIRRYDDAKVYELTDFIPGKSATRRWIPTLEIFLQRGFDFDSVYIVNYGEFNLYTEGSPLPITQASPPADTSLLQANLSEAMLRFFGLSR
jgi:hypothetical protein